MQAISFANTHSLNIHGVQRLNRGDLPPRLQTVPNKFNIDVSTTIGEYDLLGLTTGHENWLKRNLSIKKLTPSSPLGQPRALPHSIFHDDASQNTRTSLRGIASEADNTRVEARPSQHSGKPRRRGLVKARGNGKRKGGKVLSGEHQFQPSFRRSR